MNEIKFIEMLIESEERMADTINLFRPDFEGSYEQECYENHQINIVMLEKIKSKLESIY